MLFGDVAASLSKDGADCPGIKFFVSRKCERLFFSTSREASNLDVRSALGVECETEAGENRDEVIARQPLRFRHEQDPTPSLGEEWDFGKVQVPEGSLLQGGGRLLLEDW